MNKHIEKLSEKAGAIFDGSIVEIQKETWDGENKSMILTIGEVRALLRGLEEVEMKEEEPKLFECYKRLERTVKRTGKKYNQWVFVGWSPIEQKGKHTRKGKYLMVEKENGELERYVVEN